MSDTIKDRLAANINQVKVTGSNRVSSIGKILKEATSQTIAELKGGSSELSETARDTVRAATTEWKNQSREGAQPLKPTDNKYYANPGKTVASLLEAVKHSSSAEQIKEKMANLDNSLSARYGERYEAISQKRRQVLDWYSKTLADAEAEGVNPVEGRYAHLQERLGRAGSNVARKEKQIQDYFKTAFKKFEAKP
jgi:hypothetical protein